MRARIGITSAPSVYNRRRIDRVNRPYVDAVLRAGGLPLVLPTLDPADAEEVVAGIDGLVLTGGGDVAPSRYGEETAPEVYDVHSARDAWEVALVSADEAQLPILGVCRGAQLLNVAAGGTLIQHLPNVTDEPHCLRERDEEEVHPVDIEPGSLLAEIIGQRRLGVNTIHHQAIDRVGMGYRPVARPPDGIVEAIEATDGRPVVAVQWHPEALIELPAHGQLFLWLTRTAARRRPGLDVPESFESHGAAATAGRGHLVDDVA